MSDEGIEEGREEVSQDRGSLEHREEVSQNGESPGHREAGENTGGAFGMLGRGKNKKQTGNVGQRSDVNTITKVLYIAGGIIFAVQVVGTAVLVWKILSDTSPQTLQLAAAGIIFALYVIFTGFLESRILGELRHYHGLRYEAGRFNELMERMDRKGESGSNIISEEARFLGEYMIGYDEITHRRKCKKAGR